MGKVGYWAPSILPGGNWRLLVSTTTGDFSMRRGISLLGLVCALMIAACTEDDLRGVALAGLGAPPPSVTVTQRSDGLAVSWTSISVASYNVLRGGAPLAMVNAPTTSYVDAAVFAGVTYCYTVAGVFSDGSQTPASSQVCAVAAGGSGSPPPATRHLVIGPSQMVPVSPSTATFFGTHWRIDQGSTRAYFPISFPVGCTISAWNVVAQKGTATSAMSATLESINFTVVTPLSMTSANGQVGTLTLSGGATSTAIVADVVYAIDIQRDSTPSQDLIYRAGVDYSCPP